MMVNKANIPVVNASCRLTMPAGHAARRADVLLVSWSRPEIVLPDRARAVYKGIRRAQACGVKPEQT